MINRSYDRYIVFVCDECGDEEPTGTSDFLDALEHIKDCNWKITKSEEDEWEHYCWECV